MDYETAIPTVFRPAPEGTPTPRPMAEARPARRLGAAIEPLGTQAFWNRLTNEWNQERGLDFLTGYVWGRATALSEPAAGVVVSAFAWFAPGQTDGLEQPILDAIGQDFDRTAQQLGEWSQACIDARALPTRPAEARRW